MQSVVYAWRVRPDSPAVMLREVMPALQSRPQKEADHQFYGLLIVHEQTKECVMDAETLFPDESMSSQADSHARTTAWLEAVADWLATGEPSGGNSTASLIRSAPHGLWERTSQAFSPPTEVGTSEPSSRAWGNLGLHASGVFWTASGSEWPSGAAVSSLSDILEDDPDPKYSLSAKACRGILRRAEERGRSLPKPLLEALEVVALQTPTTTERREDLS